MTQTARSRAIATADNAIENNVAKIESAKRPNALESMASRLNISAASLKTTLMNTVFKDANDDQFAALVIVANEYQLNPLTKEIYAFPAKGSGIVPMVSIDGWIRIMNSHPMFDGIEFEDIPDVNGNLMAIEATIWRKDRTRPIKVTEYLEECKRNTDPWNKSPARMLRHRSLMQCARYAFGFSGIHTEDDFVAEVSLGGDLTPEPAPMRNITNKTRKDPTEGQPTEVDEETARAIDAGFDPKTGEVLTGKPDEERGEAHSDAEDLRTKMVNDWGYRLEQAEVIGTVLSIEQEFQQHEAALDEEQSRNVKAWIETAKTKFKNGGGK